MQRKGSLVAGVILIAVGAFFLLLPLFPNVADLIDIGEQWPLIIVAIGAIFLLGALLGTPSLAIPGSVLAGIGSLLYYQNLNDAWESWAYAWTLIPAFVGIGMILMGLLQGSSPKLMKNGGRLVLVSFILFVVFGTLLGGLLSFSVIGPILLILFGLWVLATNLLKRT